MRQFSIDICMTEHFNALINLNMEMGIHSYLLGLCKTLLEEKEGEKKSIARLLGRYAGRKCELRDAPGIEATKVFDELDDRILIGLGE